MSDIHNRNDYTNIINIRNTSRACRVRHECALCREKIAMGADYHVERATIGGELATVVLHPICHLRVTRELEQSAWMAKCSNSSSGRPNFKDEGLPF